MRCLFAILLLVGCGSQPGKAPVAPSLESAFGAGPPLATPGERMAYKVHLRGVEIAGYEISVGDLEDLAGRRVVVVQGWAHSTGIAEMFVQVDDRLTSWIDAESGRPQRFQSDEYESKGDSTKEQVVGLISKRDHDQVPMTVAVGGAEPATETQKVSMADVWDYNSFVLALRAWEAAPGTTHVTEVFRSRWMWHITTTIRGTETLVTDLGELPARRFDSRSYKLDRAGQRLAASEERGFSLYAPAGGPCRRSPASSGRRAGSPRSPRPGGPRRRCRPGSRHRAP